MGSVEQGPYPRNLCILTFHWRIQGGGAGGPDPPEKSQKCNTDPDPMMARLL